jgi:hypothetical protein
MRKDLTALADDWRRVLLEDPTETRPIVAARLLGRVTITPMAAKGRWLMRGEGTLTGMFQRAVSPENFPSVWRPQRAARKRGSSSGKA